MLKSKHEEIIPTKKSDPSNESLSFFIQQKIFYFFPKRITSANPSLESISKE